MHATVNKLDDVQSFMDFVDDNVGYIDSIESNEMSPIFETVSANDR